MSNKKIAPFLTKLYEIVNDKQNRTIVKWSSDGESFYIENLSDFCEKILPKHFKHTNFASFVRQLNMYDFHKNKSLSENSFHHTYFRKDRQDLLEKIKRKNNDQSKRPIRSKKKRMELESLKNDAVQIFNNIQQMNEKMDFLDKKHNVLEANQMKLYDFNQIMTKRLATLVEKDQYFEKLLVFVLKLVSQNFNFNYDMKYSDAIKTENKANNSLFEVNPYSKGNDFINKIVKDILSPVNYHHLKNTTVENLAEGLKTDKQIFHKNLNSNNGNNNISEFKNNNILDKSEVKQECDQPYPLNNIGYLNSNYANKLTAHKNFEIDKFDEKLNSAVKILNNVNEEDFNKNSIMPYENVNYLHKVAPRKKSSLAMVENSYNNINFVNEDPLNQKTEIKIEDDGVITPKAIHSHSNELANFSTSNVLDVLNNLLHSRNSLPFGDEKKMAFEPTPHSLVLLNKKRKISDLSQDERSMGSNYKCEIQKEKK